MGKHEREAMPVGMTPIPPPPISRTVTKPGEAGASADKNARDEAMIKLAESVGELAREAAEALRTERETVRIRTYNVRKWLEQMALALNAHLEEKGITFEDVVEGDKTHDVDDWWWQLYEGVFYELNDEIDPPVTLPRPVAEYKRKQEEAEKLEMTRGSDYVKTDDVMRVVGLLAEAGKITEADKQAIRNELGIDL